MTTVDEPVVSIEIPTPVLVPLGQLNPSDWNPRFIRTGRFKALCRSIAADPEFLWKRPPLAQGNGDIYAGNMRYQAVKYLWEKGCPREEGQAPIDWREQARLAGIRPNSVPAVVEDVAPRLARERALRDNNSAGEWQDEQLEELVNGLAEEGSDLSTYGFDDDDLSKLLDAAPDIDPPQEFTDVSDGVETKNKCPKCSYEW